MIFVANCRTGGFQPSQCAWIGGRKPPLRVAPRWFWSAICIIAMAGGCGGPKSDVPVGDAAENIRRLALGYVRYAGANRGVGPANKEVLAKFVAKENMVSVEEAEKFFVSPRDNQPYVVRWGRPAMGSSDGVKPPEPNILIFENTGAGGTRYVADGRMSILELSDERFSQLVPDHQPSP